VTLPFEPTVLSLVLAVFAAFIIGVSKTSVGGVATLAVGIFGALMPAKESTAAVLLLLIIGDVIGVLSYHKHADWGLLKKLLPSVLPGIALGALFVHVMPDVGLKTFIGVILVVMLILQLWTRRKPVAVEEEVRELHPVATVGTGVAAGFTTMTANAAGPIMSLYLLAARVDKTRFLGTGAFYYLIINLTKVPFSAALGLFHWSTLWLTLILFPAVLIGAWLGRILIRRVSQLWFERLTLAATAIAAVALLLP
jgi:uncharacterized membrane protein YfcA